MGEKGVCLQLGDFVIGLFTRPLPDHYKGIVPDGSLLRDFPLEQMLEFQAFLVEVSESRVKIAAVNCGLRSLRFYIRNKFPGIKHEWFRIAIGDLDRVVAQVSSLVLSSVIGSPDQRMLVDQIVGEQNISITDVIDSFIGQAYKEGASDIRITPTDISLRIRFRVDGKLKDMEGLALARHQELVSRIKVLASLRTDEHRAVQDGRFSYKIGGVTINMRASIIPTYYGESVALRLLVSQDTVRTLDSLGFLGSDIERIYQGVRRPYGMVLVTGPTGSGKTTTLYTLLNILNTSDASIVTIEDPVEYAVPGIEQIPVSVHSGLTFATGLKSILRQDPDVIMVGEIRDQETAGIAINASLTGHLVLSSLHTNDAVSSISRLLDLGVERFLLPSTLNVVIAQRLLRRICANCRVKRHPTLSEQQSLMSILTAYPGDDMGPVFFGSGCKDCCNTGFKGRIAIYEVLIVDQIIKDAILGKYSLKEIYQLAIKQGLTPMTIDAVHKAFEGITTLDEALGVKYE